MEYTPVESAKVYITYISESSYEEETLPFSYIEDGRWESDRPMEIQYNTEYTLYVDIPGREPIRAKTTCPPKVGIFNAVGFEELEIDPKAAYTIFIGPYEKGVVLQDYAAWIYAQEYSTGGWKDLDYIATDNPFADDFNVNLLKFSDLKIAGEARDEYDKKTRLYFDQLQEYWPAAPLHDKFVRIHNLEYTKRFFLVGGPKWFLNLESTDFFGRGWSQGNNYMEYNRYFCHVLSKELDVYLRSIYIHEHSLDNYLTSVYSNPNIFTNIQGGLGIFGCDCVFYFDDIF